MLHNFLERGSGNVKFYFYPFNNHGSIEWVTANTYLFTGTNLPKRGRGTIIMKHVMALFKEWMDPGPGRAGKVTLEDQSELFVGGAYWDKLRLRNHTS